MRSPEVDPFIKYIEDLYCHENEFLKSVREKGRSFSKEGMQVRPFEARLLQILIRMNRVKTIVEFGTFMGYSTLCMAQALPEDGRIFTFEKNRDHAAEARTFFKKSACDHKIDLIVGDALELVNSIETHGPFDMVFIDANKSGYIDYLKWAQTHLRSGGLLAADNTFLFGKVLQPQNKPDQSKPDKMIEVMREFNRRVADRRYFDGVVLPTSEGLTLAIKN